MRLYSADLAARIVDVLLQLLINLYLIIRYSNTADIQYVSAVLSYISLCGGVVRYDKTKKDNEADRWMVDKTLRHSRVFYTKLEWPQILFISVRYLFYGIKFTLTCSLCYNLPNTNKNITNSFGQSRF